MQIDELLEMNLFEDESLPIKIESIGQTIKKKFKVINNKVVIPITDISPKYQKNLPIELFDENNNNIGSVYALNNMRFPIASLNEEKFISYLDEIEESNFMLDDYEFKYSYLILEMEYIEEYLENYYETSPIWGNFTHDRVFPAPYISQTQRINAIKDLSYPTTVHSDTSLRALKQPYAFERFLKLYHHLELLFDKELLEKIMSLSDNYNELGILIKNFDKSEMNRLVSVMENHCTNIEKIYKHLNLIDEYKQVAKKIFFDFGKDSDPLDNDFTLLEKILLETDGFNEQNCKSHFGNKANNAEKYRKFIIKLAAYWIYRIRCSIAHNKIGEYILNHTEEEFIVEYAEPLLNEIIFQVLKK